MAASTFIPANQVFVLGQAVTVEPWEPNLINGIVDCYTRQPAFAGTIVGYWRNGYWYVRDNANGSVTAFETRVISAA